MTDDNSSTLVFQHTQTQFYRLIYSDGVAVSSYVDPGSFRYQLTFYHFDFNPITETQKVAPHDSGKGFKGLEAVRNRKCFDWQLEFAFARAA